MARRPNPDLYLNGSRACIALDLEGLDYIINELPDFDHFTKDLLKLRDALAERLGEPG